MKVWSGLWRVGTVFTFQKTIVDSCSRLATAVQVHTYGLFQLGEHDDGRGFCPWEDGYLLGDPMALFPYQSRWNLPDTFWSKAPHNKEWASEEESDRAYEAWDAKLEEVYWAPSVMNGAIPICHLGCALRQWLVVTGSERGNVWGDDRVDDGGVYPLVTRDGDRVTFSQWYLSWLDDSIRSMERGEAHTRYVP